MTVTIYGQTDQSDGGVIGIVIADTYAELAATATQDGSLGIAKDQVDGVVYQYNGSTWTTVGHSQQSLTPPQITADVHNYNPTGLENTTMLRLSSSGAWGITGLAGGVAGRELLIVNVGSTAFRLYDENASSTAANRFSFKGTGILLPASASIAIVYDATLSRWKQASTGAVLVKGLSDPIGSPMDVLSFSTPLKTVQFGTFGEATISIDNAAFAAQALSGLPTIKRKTADESVTASTVLQDDDHLILPITTTGIYYFQAMLRWNGSNATHDVKAGWSVPAGTTMDWGGGFGATSSQSTYLGSPAVIGGAPNVALDETSADSSGSRAGQFGGVYAGFIFSGGTAGNVTLQWAQNTSDAGSLTLQKDSFMMVYTLVA